ncbi:DUF2304 domain-containing protein [Ornithinibacillus scapharcae]|uniref:DUF2304 domain-containing protein n=1 Tax=Ornithinibacillus scapharcae TaxID=1147159 RepID=UPI000225AA97|nr:DUF2304 domain-containing protein [Ornithinibacillus scapharcae]
MSITIFSFVVVVLFFLIIIESVRRGVLETRDSILWIIMSIVLGILSLSEGLLEYLADLLGVHYAPSLLFLVGLLGVLIMIFDLTRRISKLNHKLTNITQEYAIFKEETLDEIEQLRDEIAQIRKKEEE